MSRRIMISAGGTGGHIYPALALSQELYLKDNSIKTLFIGGHLEKNPFFRSLSLPFETIACSTFSVSNPLKLFSSIRLNSQGVYQSIKAIKKFQPQLIVGFGSYHSLPTMVAARICGIPIILYASDSYPGKVIRLFSNYSRVTAIQFEEAAYFLKGKTKVVKMPLRQEIKNNLIFTSDAKKYFQLNDNVLTLLIFGGSQGAAAINQAVSEVIQKKGSEWVNKIQFIHLTGNDNTSKELQHHYINAGLKACIKSYEERMEMAWKAADFVLSRAGAASLAEIIKSEVPGILIPYSYAADNHQEKNCRVMKYQIGATDFMLEKDITSARLFESINSFLDNEGSKLCQMREAIKNFKNNRIAFDLSDVVLDNL